MQRVEESMGRLPPVVQKRYKDLFLSLTLHVLMASGIFGGYLGLPHASLPILVRFPAILRFTLIRPCLFTCLSQRKRKLACLDWLRARTTGILHQESGAAGKGEREEGVADETSTSIHSTCLLKELEGKQPGA